MLRRKFYRRLAKLSSITKSSYGSALNPLQFFIDLGRGLAFAEMLPKRF